MENTNKSKENYWKKAGLCLGQPISEDFKDLYWKMISSDPDSRPTIDEILNHPWIKSIENIDANELTNLNQSLKKEFESRNSKVRSLVTLEIKYREEDDTYENIIKNKTRGSSGENKVFYSEKKPKDIPDYFSEQFCIKIQDYFSADGLMNKIYEKIIRKFGDNDCFIKVDKDKFKMDVTFENEEEDDIEMKIKLYSTKNGLLLKFFRKKGNKKGFFDKFKIISELIVKFF